jgi:hypothetical protein
MTSSQTRRVVPARIVEEHERKSNADGREISTFQTSIGKTPPDNLRQKRRDAWPEMAQRRMKNDHFHIKCQRDRKRQHMTTG